MTIAQAVKEYGVSRQGITYRLKTTFPGGYQNPGTIILTDQAVAYLAELYGKREGNQKENNAASKVNALVASEQAQIRVLTAEAEKLQYQLEGAEKALADAKTEADALRGTIASLSKALEQAQHLNLIQAETISQAMFKQTEGGGHFQR